MRQQDFFKPAERAKSHGGTRSLGRRKTMRPLDRRRPVHVVMRSEHAKGKRSFLAKKIAVDQAVRGQAKRFGVTVVSFANVGNHLHVVARFPARHAFAGWLRSTAGLIARIATGARKGKPFGQKFWDALALTRVVNPGRDMRGILRYLEANRIEAEFGKESRELHLRRTPI